KLNISIDTDKKEYNPREKVVLKIKVKDKEGNPVKTNFALSVVNEQMLQYADKYRETILSKLLLQNELKGDVHMPAYYFSSTDEKCLSHLDLLMLTQGWRRIEWKDLKDDKTPLAVRAAKYNPQNYVIMGYVVDSYYLKNYPEHRSKMKLVMKETGQ